MPFPFSIPPRCKGVGLISSAVSNRVSTMLSKRLVMWRYGVVWGGEGSNGSILLQKWQQYKWPQVTWWQGKASGWGGATRRTLPRPDSQGQVCREIHRETNGGKGGANVTSKERCSFTGKTEGDGKKEEKGTSLALLLVGMACIEGGAVEVFQGLNRGSWLSFLLPSRFHTDARAFSTLFGAWWICPSFGNPGGSPILSCCCSELGFRECPDWLIDHGRTWSANRTPNPECSNSPHKLCETNTLCE